jgi:thioredoxin-dependent peroxiredoxin
MRIPHARFHLQGSPIPDENGEMEGYQIVDTADYFAGKKVILFGLPGAFTPTCTNEMLPAYEDLYDKFVKDLGIDAIYCTSVNDDYVMEAWAKSLEITKVEMIPDGNAELADGIGMLVKKTNVGFGNRSWRYAAYVVDGEIELMLDEEGMCHNLVGDPYEESTPLNAYRRIKEHLGIQDEEEE